MTSVTISAVGHVRGGRDVPEDDDWAQSRATIELDPARFTPEALTGLDSFSQAEVVFLFDRVAEDEVTYDARHPRGNRSWPKVGIFAQRGKNRPSPHRGERLSHSGCARAVARR